MPPGDIIVAKPGMPVQGEPFSAEPDIVVSKIIDIVAEEPAFLPALEMFAPGIAHSLFPTPSVAPNGDVSFMIAPSGLYLRPEQGCDLVSYLDEKAQAVGDVLGGASVIKDRRVVVKMDNWPGPPSDLPAARVKAQELATALNAEVVLKWRDSDGPTLQTFKAESPSNSGEAGTQVLGKDYLKALGLVVNKPDPGPWTDRNESWGGIAAGSHKGVGYKNHNEDRYAMEQREDGSTIMVAIDGMGGQANGELAAEWTMNAFETVLPHEDAESAVRMAHQLVRAESKKAGYSNPNGSPKEHAPDAVAMAVEITPRSDGDYDSKFVGVGDSEALVIRLGDNFDEAPRIVHHTTRPTSIVMAMRQSMRKGAFWLLSGGRMPLELIGNLRNDPFAHYAEGGMNMGGDLQIDTPDEPLKDKDIVLAGTDGFFENFSNHEIIADIVREMAVRTGRVPDAAEIKDELMTEVKIRQGLMKVVDPSGMITHQDYVEAYKLATGEDAPEGWHGRYEAWTDESDRQHVYSLDNTGNVTETVNDKTDTAIYQTRVDHFKSDNVTLMVQVVGDTVVK